MPRLVDQVIEELSKSKAIDIEAAGSKFTAAVRLPAEDFWDVSLSKRGKTVGYAVVSKHKLGFYELQNQDINQRYGGMIEGQGWGVEVLPEYQRRHIGHALLSMAIGLAIRDFEADSSLEEFEVRAYGLNGSEPFYKKFGFITKCTNWGNGIKHITGTFSKLTVPDISIKASKSK